MFSLHMTHHWRSISKSKERRLIIRRYNFWVMQRKNKVSVSRFVKIYVTVVVFILVIIIYKHLWMQLITVCFNFVLKFIYNIALYFIPFNFIFFPVKKFFSNYNLFFNNKKNSLSYNLTAIHIICNRGIDIL